MKKKFYIKPTTVLTLTIFSLTYIFLMPFAYAQPAHALVKPAQAQETPNPTPTTTSKLYIPTGANSTYLTTSDGQTALLIQDHLSSTRVIDEAGTTTLVDQQYYPYGTTMGQSQDITDKQFTSHRSLADTGVYHAAARFYNPQLGMFVSADKVQGPNRYAYAMNNPALLNDPTGEIVPIIIAVMVAGAIIGGTIGASKEAARQRADWGEVQDKGSVAVRGAVGALVGAAVGAGVGYAGTVALPAMFVAGKAGVVAGSAAGIRAGVAIGAGACNASPACLGGVEMAAEAVLGGSAGPGSAVPAGPRAPRRAVRPPPPRPVAPPPAPQPNFTVMRLKGGSYRKAMDTYVDAWKRNPSIDPGLRMHENGDLPYAPILRDYKHFKARFAEVRGPRVFDRVYYGLFARVAGEDGLRFSPASPGDVKHGMLTAGADTLYAGEASWMWTKGPNGQPLFKVIDVNLSSGGYTPRVYQEKLDDASRMLRSALTGGL